MYPSDISEVFGRISSALIDGNSAWLTPGQIAAAVGESGDDTLDALAGLDVAGLVEVWAEHDPLVVTLTPLAVARLGIRLIETQDALIFQWSRDSASARSRRAPTPRRLRIETEAHDRALREIVDPRDRGQEDLDRRLDELEHAEGRRRDRRHVPRDELPAPIYLLEGFPLFPWDERPRQVRHRMHCVLCAPGAGRRLRRKIVDACQTCGRFVAGRYRGSLCPGCHGLQLPRSTLCLRCGSWGWDRAKRRRKVAGQ